MTAAAIRRVLPLAALLLSTGGACADPAASLFTSTRCVTSIALTSDRAVWIGTTGGILVRSAGGAWRRLTAADGLPSQEVQRLIADGTNVTAVFPAARATWDGRAWRVAPAPLASDASRARPICVARWNGERVIATPAGLVTRVGKATRRVALPPSRGSHVSALLSRGGTLLAAMYGDGLWAWDGTSWRPAEPRVPAQAREITAVAARGSTLWIGTRRQGAWQWDGTRWTQHVQPDEPWDHNVQSLAEFDGALYAGTLEDGLLVRKAGAWRRTAPPDISTSAPRQMVAFEGALYVRHANGKVDRLERGAWQRDVFARIPRSEVNAVAVDGNRLFAAQWGGWSEFDGTRWNHHLDRADFQGVQTTAIRATDAAIWIGTQGRGIAEVDRRTGAVRWHDARVGLADDWITAIETTGGAVWAGTFVGGLAAFRDGRWTVVRGTEGSNVTSLTRDGDGVILAARGGVWRARGNGAIGQPLLKAEAQAVCLTAEGLWVGTRTGLYLLPR